MSLREAKIGVFGAGHLARALALCLLRGGVKDTDLSLCHRGSDATRRALAEAGLAYLARPAEDVLMRSEILLYTVRPQDCTAIAEYSTPDDQLFVSFLAGVPLERIPVRVPKKQKARVMPSAPDTLMRENAIAAVYPAGNPTVHALLKLIGVRIYPLTRESDMHAFTVLGPCLPVALALWESLGKTVVDHEVLGVAEHFELPDPVGILKWARGVQPNSMVGCKLDSYLTQAATEGGVTEAILQAIRDGKSLSDSLCTGIRRSQQLGRQKVCVE